GLVFGTSSNKFENSDYNYPITPVMHHGGWQWISDRAKVKTVLTTPDTLMCDIWYYTNCPIQIYEPTVLYIPAGTMDENEIAELSVQMAGFGGGIAKGALATHKGQRFAMWDAALGDWRYLDVNGNVPRVSFANGTAVSSPIPLVSTPTASGTRS